MSLCALAATTAGCAAPYYWQAIGGHLELLRKREPIEDVVADPAVDPKLQTTLTRIAAMRRFASDELGLPSNDSYTSYVALDRSYVVWNVVATDEFSVEPRRWCFPFAGCVAYRGYFERAKAEHFAQQLAEDGLDTHSGGSTAYSTLGYFADPVLSTMVNGGEQYVASLLFHELAHQKLYIKDDSEFSEAFAMVVEEFGTQQWLLQHGTPADLERYRGRRARRVEFAELIAAQQARLRAVYSTGGSPEQLRAAKALAFDALRLEYAGAESDDVGGEHGLRRVVRAAAQQCDARVGRHLYALVARAARAARSRGARGVLRGRRGARGSRCSGARGALARLGGQGDRAGDDVRR